MSSLTTRFLASHAHLYIDMCQIDGITAAMTHLIPQLNILRNCSLPIYKLPAELLTTIFVSLVDLPPSRVGDEIDRQPYCDALTRLSKLTLVCQHWHDVLIRIPSLWSQIFYPTNRSKQVTSLPIAVRCFERSSTLPTAVIYHADSHTSSHRARARDEQSFQDQIVLHLSRIRDLRVVNSGPWEKLPFLHSHAAPQLQTLVLGANGGASGHNTHRVFASHQSILEQSFSPLLHTLSVSGIHPWTPFRLPTNLRCLCVLDLLWTLEDVVKVCIALASLPVLEELVLSLHGLYPAYGEPPHLEHGQYVLQVLKRFVMRDKTMDGFAGAHLLSLLRFPHDCVQNIHIRTFHTIAPSLPGHAGLNIAHAQQIYFHRAQVIAVRDGSTACCLTSPDMSAIDLHFRQLQAVTELWLATDVPEGAYSRLATVKKLVFMSSERLETFIRFGWDRDRTLPDLTEIHVFMERGSRRLNMHHYLSTRHEAGRPLEALRIFAMEERSNSRGMSDDELRTVHNVCSRLREVVQDVSFNIVKTFPQMELPPDCTTPSTLHNYWDVAEWATSS